MVRCLLVECTSYLYSL